MTQKEISYKFRQDVGIYLIFWGAIYVGLTVFCDREVQRYNRTAQEILFCILHPLICWAIGVAMSGAYGKYNHLKDLPPGMTNPSKMVRYKPYIRVPFLGKFFIAFLMATGIRAFLIPRCTLSIFQNVGNGYKEIIAYESDGTILDNDLSHQWKDYQYYKKTGKRPGAVLDN